MRRFLVASLIAAFCIAGVSESQVRKDPPAKADPLEELRAEALKNNPDIKVAEAKLRLAQEELERSRTNLKAQLGVAFAEVEAARAGLAEGNERHLRAGNLYFKKKAISKEEYRLAELTMLKLKSELGAKEAHLNALLGRTAKVKEPKK